MKLDTIRRYYGGQLSFFLQTFSGEEPVVVTIDDVTWNADDGALVIHGQTYRGNPNAAVHCPNLTMYCVTSPRVEDDAIIGSVTVNGPDLPPDTQTLGARIVPTSSPEFRQIRIRASTEHASL